MSNILFSILKFYISCHTNYPDCGKLNFHGIVKMYMYGTHTLVFCVLCHTDSGECRTIIFFSEILIEFYNLYLVL